MYRSFMAVTAAAILATSAYAQPAATAQPSQTAKPAPKPQTCEMMHGTTKMQGVMVKGKDGKLVCQMMDHSTMDHGAMGHDQGAHDPHAGHGPH
jgi:uncharacterized protein involved in copper resistance